MSRIICRSILALAPLVLGVVWMTTRVSGQSETKKGTSVRSTNAGLAAHSTKNGEWPQYTGDLAGTRYSPLDQINAENFNKLEVAWRFKTDNLGTRPEFKLEALRWWLTAYSTQP